MLNNNQKCQASYVFLMPLTKAQQWMRFCLEYHCQIGRYHSLSTERGAKWSSQNEWRAITYCPRAQGLLQSRSHMQILCRNRNPTPSLCSAHNISTCCLFSGASIVRHFFLNGNPLNGMSWLFKAQSWATTPGVSSQSLGFLCYLTFIE